MKLLSDLHDKQIKIRAESDVETLKIGRRGLENLVPHRGIALCLDKISYLHSEGKHLFANWTPGERYFSGHFPAKAVLPGHWQGESASLAAACLARLAHPETSGLPALVKIDINFKRPVLFGETIYISVAIIERQKRKLTFVFRIFNDSEKTISEGTIIGMPMKS